MPDWSNFNIIFINKQGQLLSIKRATSYNEIVGSEFKRISNYSRTVESTVRFDLVNAAIVTSERI